jgi:hypothetical protein
MDSNNTLHNDLQTLAARWGDWKTAIRAVGADAMDIRMARILLENPYHKRNTPGREDSLFGHIDAALAMPAFTFADLDSLTTRLMGRYTLESLVRAYHDAGGKITTTHAVRKARKSGKLTAEMVRFLSFCSRYLQKSYGQM